MPKQKKIIRPHKGGRSENWNIRLTPDEKESLKIFLKIQGLIDGEKVSLADWVVSQIHPASPQYWNEVLIDREAGDFDEFKK